jgi:hypothetical protein
MVAQKVALVMKMNSRNPEKDSPKSSTWNENEESRKSSPGTSTCDENEDDECRKQ